jgi:hypothetical protein
MLGLGFRRCEKVESLLNRLSGDTVTNFDGMFALNYILPLAQAAYSEPWNAARDPILDSFTQVQELFADESSTIRDSGGSADAESQRENCSESESRRLKQLTQRVTQISK